MTAITIGAPSRGQTTAMSLRAPYVAPVPVLSPTVAPSGAAARMSPAPVVLARSQRASPSSPF